MDEKREIVIPRVEDYRQGIPVLYKDGRTPDNSDPRYSLPEERILRKISETRADVD